MSSQEAVEKELQAQIQAAVADRSPVRISGHGSKSFTCRKTDMPVLSTQSLHGIVEYEPSELVVTVKAGHALRDLEQTLAERGQHLAFEPPIINGKGTVGGMVASGLAGPGRPWTGSVRDYVLGMNIINGKGQSLSFGGQVMKNVAGYDVSRMMVGAFGCLGLITQVSLKVLPLPPHTSYFFLAASLTETLASAARWRQRMSPVTGVSHDGVRGRVRLQGSGESIESFAKAFALEVDASGAEYWSALRHIGTSFASKHEKLWRLVVPQGTDLSTLVQSKGMDITMDWGGAQYWVRGDDETKVAELAAASGADLYAMNEGALQPLPALPEPILALHQNLKQAYDPQRVLNPGLMYETL